MKFYIGTALYSVIFSLISFSSGIKTLYVSSVSDSMFIKPFIGARISLIVLLLFGNKKLKPLTVGPMLLKYVSGIGQSTSAVFRELVLSCA